MWGREALFWVELCPTKKETEVLTVSTSESHYVGMGSQT